MVSYYDFHPLLLTDLFDFADHVESHGDLLVVQLVGHHKRGGFQLSLPVLKVLGQPSIELGRLLGRDDDDRTLYVM